MSSSDSFLICMVAVFVITVAICIPVKQREYDKELYQKVFLECLAVSHNAKECRKAAEEVSEIID